MARGQISFHSGALFAKTGLTSIQVATLQEVTFDFKSSNKRLMGETQFAEAVGRGSTEITGKAKSGRFNGALLNQVFLQQPGANVSAAADLLALAEEGTVASAAVTVANAADFLEDLGVTLAGSPLTRVASGPTATQYSVNEGTGVYSFHASVTDGTKVKISYLYESTAAGAQTIAITNQQVGEAPTFRAIFVNKFQAQTLTLVLNALVADSLGFGFKNEEFAMPEFAFGAQADANGDVGRLSGTAFA